ncbi:MAG: acyl-CoA thioesterase [Mucilaginibacter sp.]|nr:acyl-CoA thioesterase [Mucilaginibacter sp.]
MLLSVSKKIITGLFILITIFSSCKKSHPVVATTTLTLNERNKAAYFTKVSAHSLVRIGCEGTSLTYGQNVPGVNPPINGATQQRALYQYPSSMQVALQTYGINANVINRGFPGDRTTEGIARWKDSTIADVVIVEYGTNDCFNFGGYSTGVLTIPAFTDSLSKIVKRRLNQGAWVIINSPPDLNPVDTAINKYKTAIVKVAATFNLQVFDVQKSVIQSSADYFDGVHLTATAYQRWGNNIAIILEKP